MQNRLIVLIDFSVYSHALAELATRWSVIANAQLVFVHQIIGAVPGLADKDSKQEVAKSEKEEAVERLEKFISAQNLDGTKVRHVVTESHLLHTIGELVEEDYDDIIMVGIRGTGMLKQLLIGHTATTIINDIDHTVVAVPDKLCAVPNQFCNLLPRRLVVSLTERFPLNDDALSKFLSKFEKEIQSVEFISSIESDIDEEQTFQYLSSLATKYSQVFKTSFELFKGKNPFEQIKNFVQREQDTILVVQKGSRNLTDLLFRKFLISKVVHDGSLPMVVLPNTSVRTE